MEGRRAQLQKQKDFFLIRAPLESTSGVPRQPGSSKAAIRSVVLDIQRRDQPGQNRTRRRRFDACHTIPDRQSEPRPAGDEQTHSRARALSKQISIADFRRRIPPSALAIH